MEMKASIENPYMTFVAWNEGATRKERALMYWSDFVELLGCEKATDNAEALLLANLRYVMLTECLFDEGDVTLEELRGFIDGIATVLSFPKENREWLHDAFEWVLK